MPVAVNDLIGVMVDAAWPFLEKGGEVARAYAASECAKMARTLTTILELERSGQIDQGQAEALLEMQKQAAMAVFCAIQGIGLVAAQNAINAALDAIRKFVNDAIKFPLV